MTPLGQRRITFGADNLQNDHLDRYRWASPSVSPIYCSIESNTDLSYIYIHTYIYIYTVYQYIYMYEWVSPKMRYISLLNAPSSSSRHHGTGVFWSPVWSPSDGCQGKPETTGEEAHLAPLAPWRPVQLPFGFSEAMRCSAAKVYFW